MSHVKAGACRPSWFLSHPHLLQLLTSVAQGSTTFPITGSFHLDQLKEWVHNTSPLSIINFWGGNDQVLVLTMHDNIWQCMRMQMAHDNWTLTLRLLQTWPVKHMLLGVHSWRLGSSAWNLKKPCSMLGNLHVFACFTLKQQSLDPPLGQLRTIVIHNVQLFLLVRLLLQSWLSTPLKKREVSDIMKHGNYMKIQETNMARMFNSWLSKNLFANRCLTATSNPNKRKWTTCMCFT